MAIGYRSNRKLIKWLNTPASSVLEWADSEAYVLCCISEFLEVGIKCLIYSGTFLEKNPLICFLLIPLQLLQSHIVLETPPKKPLTLKSLNWDLLLGKCNLKPSLRWFWWETDVGTCLDSSSLDWRRQFYIYQKFLSFPRCRDGRALGSGWKSETQVVTKHSPCLFSSLCSLCGSSVLRVRLCVVSLQKWHLGPPWSSRTVNLWWNFKADTIDWLTLYQGFSTSAPLTFGAE